MKEDREQGLESGGRREECPQLFVVNYLGAEAEDRAV